MNVVAEYLQSYHNYFWQYEDRGIVIAVPHGPTIGYSEYILKEMIFYLAPQGLPRFGSLLLALAATNSYGADTLDDIQKLVEQHIQNVEITQGIAFAKLLSEVPIRYKKGNLRLELLRGIFSSSHNSIGVKRSLKIVAELEKLPEIHQYEGALTIGLLSNDHIINDFRTLSLIGRKLDSVEKILASLTNLPAKREELEHLEFEVEKATDEEDFINQLLKDQNTFHVGALVSRLISGLHIPFHAGLPGPQPLGGVADITNKGNFDKLLISEFAFDDHIFMSRIANNESLFHRRETPPTDNKYSRIMIIDSSLKNWGTIRTISFAAMLAITNHPKNRNPCRVFLVGKDYQEIGFETVDDIIDGLQLLDASLDPGIGLMKLFANEQMSNSETFFIGNKESLEGIGMLKFKGEFGNAIDHWIHPTEQGEISVYKNPKRGRMFVQELKLPLGELWAKPKRKTPHITTSQDYHYPILFPGTKFKVIWHGEKHTYAVTKDKALLRSFRTFNSDARGWELVSNSFLPSDNLRAAMTHNFLSVTVLVSEQANNFSLINYPSGERIKVELNRVLNTCKEFFVQDGLFKGTSYSKTVYIDLNGKVSEYGNELYTYKKQQHIKKTGSLYKNIYKIYITTDNELRIGTQDLVLRNSNLYLMHRGHHMSVKIQATQSSPGRFVFPDGSFIDHNRNGMLTLISSNEPIPKIFIPSVLNSVLGVATESTFAGKPYFQMKHRVEILLGPNKNKLQSVKSVKSSLGNISLFDAKQMIDTGVITWDDEKELISLRPELDRLHVPYSIRTRGLQQEVIKPVDFYKKYIQAFIQHIVTHGIITD